MIHLECHLNEWNTVTVLINNILFFSPSLRATKQVQVDYLAIKSGLRFNKKMTLWTATTADI